MDPELDRLEGHIQQLIAGSQRLADENRQLRQALEEARLAQQTLRQRMDEARAQVRSALGRLPDAAPQE
ncbi:MAG: hypothetical protein KGQ67_15265 [Betaproteobacteria bacterium]|nr:hypothetical protein [Betaproteobacteria bacterium]